MVTDTYDVVLLGFGERAAAAGGESPIEAMQRLFQIDAETAGQLVASAPVTVKHGATEDVAKLYVDGLRSIGARVEVHPAALRAPARRPTPPPVAAAPREAETSVEREPGFYASLPSALIMPLRGMGAGWLAAAVGLAFVAIVGGMAPLVGCVVQIVVLPAVLTVVAKYFQACMAATAMGRDRPQGFPDIMNFFGELVLPGLALTLWFLAANVPLLLWISRAGDLSALVGGDAFTHPVTLALAAIPYALWPAALARGAAVGSFFSMFNLPRIVIGLLRAPLAYLVVLALGAAGFVAPALLNSYRTEACGGFLRNLTIFVVEIAVLAYAHGVMGAAMGHLARVEPAVVDGGS